MELNFRKRKAIGLICLIMSLIIGSSTIVFADSNEGVFEDCDIKTDFHAKNVNGENVTIAIDEDIVKNISSDDVENILTDGYGQDHNNIQVVEKSNLTDNDIKCLGDGALYIYAENSLVGFQINPEIANDIDSEEIIDIFDESENEALISVNNIIASDNVSNAVIQSSEENLERNSRGLTYYIKNLKAQKSGNQYVSSDHFIISVAKGHSITLSKSKSWTSKFSVDGGYHFVKADLQRNLTGSLTAAYGVKHKWEGPGKNSKYNSREFRVKFVRQKWTRIQEKRRRVTDTLLDTRTAKLSAPVKYIEYSKDLKVK